jgi:ATP:ADP antiporter, AAA family
MSNASSLSDFFSVQKGERLKTFSLFSWLFLFICVYYVLRPIRRGMVLEGLGNEYMPFVYMGTALVTGVVVWVYSKFAYLPRKKLIGSIYGIFFVNLLMWWQAFQFESKITSGLFWIWLDVFSIMGVTLFWMYANDIFNSQSAKRLFGIVAAGGGLGAVLGSTITASLVNVLGATNMLLVAAGLIACTLGIFLFIESNSEKDQPVKRVPSPAFEKEKVSGLGKAFNVLMTNKLLMLLTVVVCFERITPDLIQYIYHEVLHDMAHGANAIAALDANLERWRAVCEFVIELFFVGIVLRKVGSAPCLASSGVCIAGSLLTFAVFANPMIVVAIFHVDEALRHSWFKAAKELTYTVTSRDVLYTVKPVIEMFCYRFARGFAGIMILLVNTVCGFGTPGIIVMGVISSTLWVVAALKLNTEFKRLELEALFAKEGGEPVKKDTKEFLPA